MADYENEKIIWQDQEVLFDVDKSRLELCPGEYAADVIYRVEDTKGNAGMEGTLTITNLRLIWVSSGTSAINLSMGFSCLKNLAIHSARSALRGVSQALFIVFASKSSQYEFVFTHLHQTSPRMFSSVQAVQRAYDTSKLYRNLTLRGGFVQNKRLVLLPQEEQYSSYDGVWSLSSQESQGSLGTLVVTSVRVVWFSNNTDNFNVSIPYLKITQMCSHDSKFGRALVISAVSASDPTKRFTLGFKIDPESRLVQIKEELIALIRAFRAKPFFGITRTVVDVASATPQPAPRASDVTVTKRANPVDPLSRYMVRAQGGRAPILDPGLGLLVEAPPTGYHVADLFALGGLGGSG
ncbi:Bardet-Biedl syndrome 5 protein [Carpediemonas membranifera]|uniref:BBSome complex member BBS5 n=1 Tax=Carpediemonas membranifera TaxID=201153 RepID=A0A8J6ATH8_9EUKA|nr:Bardet-Biedl syndrome 5 protein [Carpediemonas membranifera]|eukprot:KAG9392015.1 Bardet-Biedl syndrome 5 protein [Carpediemonas membranifera]